MIPDESVIEEALEEDEPASDIDFSEGGIIKFFLKKFLNKWNINLANGFSQLVQHF